MQHLITVSVQGVLSGPSSHLLIIELHCSTKWFSRLSRQVFDECHKAKNGAAGQKETGTKVAATVLALQQRLPRARIVYCSATGISEVGNMTYMSRLVGLPCHPVRNSDCCLVFAGLVGLFALNR